MSKFLGFLLGIAVALVGPAMFGVLAADGGIELNAKEMALAYGIGALIFWTVVSYFSGAAALGAALTFGAMIYAVHWIPNRTTNFLNDVPGVTTGMIDGIKQYTLNGVVPILAVISLIYGIQLIVQAVHRRRRERAEAERLQREQEAAQAQQEVDPTAAYPVAGGEYQPAANDRFSSNFGNSNYDDLFDEEPTSYPPRNQADEQTAQFPSSSVERDAVDEGRDDTSEYRRTGDETDAQDAADETVLVPTDRDETVTVPAAESRDEATNETAETDQAADEDEAGQEGPAAGRNETVADGTGRANDETQVPPAAPAASAASAAAPPSTTAATATPPAPPASSTTPATQTPEPSAAAPAVASAQQAERPKAAAPEVEVPKAAAQPQPAKGPASAYEVPMGAMSSQRNDEMGRQYRERMDGPDVDDTGEFQVGTLENPPVSEEGRPQSPRIMDLPGQFRPTGA